MKERPTEFTLRSAIADDWEFIWQLRIVTMKSPISRSYGRHEARQRGYAAESLRDDIVLVENNQAGVITISNLNEKSDRHFSKQRSLTK